MNYMEQVAKMLGVEIGEKFEVKNYDDLFWFDNNGLTTGARRYYKSLLSELLNGNAEIIRKPWSPKCGEVYYSALPSHPDLWDDDIWDDGRINTFLYESKLVFRTKEEAVEASKKMLKALEG